MHVKLLRQSFRAESSIELPAAREPDGKASAFDVEPGAQDHHSRDPPALLASVAALVIQAALKGSLTGHVGAENGRRTAADDALVRGARGVAVLEDR
jgi:hypothetical protein